MCCAISDATMIIRYHWCMVFSKVLSTVLLPTVTKHGGVWQWLWQHKLWQIWRFGLYCIADVRLVLSIPIPVRICQHNLECNNDCEV